MTIAELAHKINEQTWTTNKVLSSSIEVEIADTIQEWGRQLAPQLASKIADEDLCQEPLELSIVESLIKTRILKAFELPPQLTSDRVAKE